MKRNWDLRAIMLRAWKLWRKGGLTFGKALHRAWAAEKVAPINAQRIEEAKAAAGISEETATWASWKALGYEVIHGSKAIFGVDLVHTTRGDGAIYKARFFGRSQVQPVA